MKIDTSDYYPTTPGSGCEPDAESAATGREDHSRFMPGHSEEEKRESQPAEVIPHAADYEPKATKEEETPAEGKTSTEKTSERKVSGGKERDSLKGVDLAANIISWVLVPLLIPTYAMLVIFKESILFFVPFETKAAFTAIIFTATALLPMLLVLLLKKLGIVQDIGLNGRKERLVPYIIMIVSYVCCGYYLVNKGAPEWTGMFFYGGALAALINLVINFKWKISAHAAAMGGMIALIISISKDGVSHPDMVWLVSATVLLGGLLGAARVWLGRHTVAQVLCGTAVGFLSVFLLSLTCTA